LLAADPEVDQAITRIAEDWLSSQGGQAAQTQIRQLIADHPQLGNAITRIAEEWLSGQGIAGPDLGRWLLRDSPEHLGETFGHPEAGTLPGSPVGWRVAHESPGESRAVALSGEGEPASGPYVTAAAANRDSDSATVRSEQPASAPPTPSDSEQPSDVEWPAGREAAEFVTRFLPFDPASLQQEVSGFLDGLGSAIQVVPEQLFPDAWRYVAAFVTGAGAVVAVGKWRSRTTRTRTQPARQTVGSTVLAAEEAGES
jgi:hypothetical protein